MTKSMKPPAFTLESLILSRGLGTTCDDRAGLYGNVAWIIDGATQTDELVGVPALSQGAWIAEVAAAQLSELAIPAFEGTSQELISALAAAVHTELTALAWPQDRLSPVCSLGFVILRTDWTVEMCTIGDVSILRVRDGSADRLFDSRFLDNERAAVLATATSNDEMGASARARDAAGINERRRQYLHGPDGPVVLGDNPDAWRRALTKEVSIEDEEEFILASDGLMRAVDAYQLMSLDEFADRVRRGDACGVLTDLREYEDATLRDEPAEFFKGRDDAGLIALRVIPRE